jgi:hypothetical protein
LSASYKEEIQKIIPTREELAWVAGFVEGEGHIGISSSSTRKFRFLQVTITNTDMNLLLNVKRLFGGKIIVARKGTEIPKHNTAYRWYTQCSKAVLFLKAIEPFIVSAKKQQFAFCYSFQEIKNQRKANALDNEGKIDALISKINSYNSPPRGTRKPMGDYRAVKTDG